MSTAANGSARISLTKIYLLNRYLPEWRFCFFTITVMVCPSTCTVIRIGDVIIDGNAVCDGVAPVSRFAVKNAIFDKSVVIVRINMVVSRVCCPAVKIYRHTILFIGCSANFAIFHENIVAVTHPKRSVSTGIRRGAVFGFATGHNGILSAAKNNSAIG